MKRKRITTAAVVLSLLLSLFPVGAGAAGLSIIVDAPETLPAADETFTVTVSLEGNTGIGVAEYTLTYNEAVVACEDLVLGPVLQSMMAATNPAGKGGATVACASTKNSRSDGVMSEYTFRVLKNGDPGFGLTSVLMADAEEHRLDFTVTVHGTAPADAAPDETGGETPAEPEKPETDKTPETDEPAVPIEDAETPSDETEPGDGQSETGTEALVFQDVPEGYWAYPYIMRATEMGLLAGVGGGLFSPERAMTRAEFTTVLYRLAGSPAVTQYPLFTDVSESDWFFQAVSWAAEAGYVKGSDGRFKPGDPITRQDVVTILFRYSGSQSGMEALLGSVYDNLFEDSAEISDYAKPAIHWAIYNGIITGVTETTIAPKNTAKRAQIAAIFLRYIDQISSSGGTE